MPRKTQFGLNFGPWTARVLKYWKTMYDQKDAPCSYDSGCWSQI